MNATEVIEYNKCRTTPLYFIEKYFKVNHPVQGNTNITLNIKQISILKNHIENRMIFDRIDQRQLGATTLHVAYALGRVLFEPHSIVVIGNITYKEAAMARQIFNHAYEQIPDYLKSKITTNNKRDIVFDNGNTLLFKNSDLKNYKATSFSHIILDNFEFYDKKDRIEFENYSKIFYPNKTVDLR